MEAKPTVESRSVVCCPMCMARTRTSIRYGDVRVCCEHCGRYFEVVIRPLDQVVVAEPAPAPPVSKPEAGIPGTEALRPAKTSRTPRPFQGGPLVFHPDRITLCGVTIVTDKGTGQSMMMLSELAKKERGRFVRRSAEDLKKAIGATSVQTITGCAKTIRTNIKDRLYRDLNLACGDQDVLVRDSRGYHLKEWIEFRKAQEEDEGPSGGAPLLHNDPANSPSCITADTDGLNERQKWVIDQISGGQNVRRANLECKFGVSSKTAKRDMMALVRAGRIEFIRKPHPGHYRSKRV